MENARDRQPELLGLLDQQIAAATTLLGILKTERETLKTRDIEGVSRSGDLKHHCLDELDALDADRRQLSELVGLLERCRDLHEANGRLVALERQHVQQALSALRGADPDTRLYGSDGSPAGLASGLPISSVHTPRPATRRGRTGSGGTGPGADHIIVRSASGGLLREDDTVTADQDRKFFDMFMIVLGSLVGIAVAIYALAQAVQAESQAEARRQDPIVQAQIEARIRPVGQVAIAGQDNSALDGPGGMGSGTETAAAAAAPAQALSGEEVYNLACAACHAAGVAGAPKFAEAAAWSARIEQGVDTLVSHAINGYSGSAGYMPPKGGRTDLSDDAVRAAVEYMVAAAQ